MIPINPEAIGDPNTTPVVYLGVEEGRALGIRQRDGHLTPIVSGLTPAAGGRLSKERTEKLSGDLAGLRAARQRAWAKLRSAAHLSEEETTQ